MAQEEKIEGGALDSAKQVVADDAVSEVKKETKSLDNGSDHATAETLDQKSLDKKFAERAERARKAERERILTELGVNSLDELKALKPASKEENDRLSKLESSLETMKRENVFLKAGVDEKSADDVARYIKGGGEDFTLEAVNKALERNPQWKSGYQNTIRGVQIGTTGTPKEEISDEEKAWAKKVASWFDEN